VARKLTDAEQLEIAQDSLDAAIDCLAHGLRWNAQEAAFFGLQALGAVVPGTMGWDMAQQLIAARDGRTQPC
jgi:hypothetical protein